MNFFQKFRDFVLHPTHSRTIALLVLLVLVSAVSLTVIVAQQQQQLKQRANFDTCDPTYNDALVTCANADSQCRQNCTDYAGYEDCIASCDNANSKCKADADKQLANCISPAIPTPTSSQPTAPTAASSTELFELYRTAIDAATTLDQLQKVRADVDADSNKLTISQRTSLYNDYYEPKYLSLVPAQPTTPAVIAPTNTPTPTPTSSPVNAKGSFSCTITLYRSLAGCAGEGSPGGTYCSAKNDKTNGCDSNIGAQISCEPSSCTLSGPTPTPATSASTPCTPEGNAFCLGNAISICTSGKLISSTCPGGQICTPNATGLPQCVSSTTTLPTPIPAVGDTVIRLPAGAFKTLFTNKKDLSPITSNDQDLTIYLYKSTDDPSKDPKGLSVAVPGVNIKLASSGTASIGFYLGKVTPGTYKILLKSPKYLRTLVDTKEISATGGTVILNLNKNLADGAGDVDDNNILDIRDYNIILGCSGTKKSTSACTGKDAADLNDDGNIDGIDHNIFITSLSFTTREGD